MFVGAWLFVLKKVKKVTKLRSDCGETAVLKVSRAVRKTKFKFRTTNEQRSSRLLCEILHNIRLPEPHQLLHHHVDGIQVEQEEEGTHRATDNAGPVCRYREDRHPHCTVDDAGRRDQGRHHRQRQVDLQHWKQRAHVVFRNLQRIRRLDADTAETDPDDTSELCVGRGRGREREKEYTIRGNQDVTE